MCWFLGRCVQMSLTPDREVTEDKVTKSKLMSQWSYLQELLIRDQAAQMQRHYWNPTLARGNPGAFYTAWRWLSRAEGLFSSVAFTVYITLQGEPCEASMFQGLPETCELLTSRVLWSLHSQFPSLKENTWRMECFSSGRISYTMP